MTAGTHENRSQQLLFCTRRLVSRSWQELMQYLGGWERTQVPTQHLTDLVQVHEQVLRAQKRYCGHLFKRVPCDHAQPLIAYPLGIVTRALSPAVDKPEFFPA